MGCFTDAPSCFGWTREIVGGATRGGIEFTSDLGERSNVFRTSVDPVRTGNEGKSWSSCGKYVIWSVSVGFVVSDSDVCWLAICTLHCSLRRTDWFDYPK